MGADLQGEAALRGESIGTVAIRRCRDALDRKGSVSGSTWRRLDEGLRLVLLTMCTQRNPDTAQWMPWDQFTADERAAIGATARTWARSLQGAAWLR